MIGYKFSRRKMEKVIQLLDEWGVSWWDGWNLGEIEVEGMDRDRLLDASEMAESDLAMEDMEYLKKARP